MPPASMGRSRSTRSATWLVSGAASIGINAQTQGDVTITSAGSITAGPNSSVGILALSQSGNVSDHHDRRHRQPPAASRLDIYAQAGATATVLSGEPHPDARRRFTGHHSHGFFRRGRCRHRQHHYDGCRVRRHLCSQPERLGANRLDRRHSDDRHRLGGDPRRRLHRQHGDQCRQCGRRVGVHLRRCRRVHVQRRRQRTDKPRLDIGPVRTGDLFRDLGRHQYLAQLRHHHGRRHPGWAKLLQQPRRCAVQLRSARAGRLADERGHDRAGRPGGCRPDAARRPLRADADRHLRGGCKRWHGRPDRRLRHRPAGRQGGREHRLSADARADALRDPDGTRRRYRQRPQPVGQPGLACRAFLPRSRDGGTRHRRRFHDERSERQRDVGRQQSQLGVGCRRGRGDARAARAAQYAWAAKLQGGARSAAACDLPGQPDRRTAGQSVPSRTRC